MKAVSISEPGGPEVLRLVDRPKPEPGRGEIRVRVVASALNRADVIQRRGGYPAPPGVAPDVPGLEYAGEVDALGENVTLWSAGHRVMGIVGGGAHAEYVCVHEREVLSVPPALGWEEAAAVPEAFLTAYDALVRQAGLRRGHRVLIHAVGSGVGTAAVQLARAFGATTFGTSRSPDKLDQAREIGLDYGFDSSNPGWPERVAAASGTGGIDIVLDLVGGPLHAASLQLLGHRATLMVVGLVGGNRVETDLGLLLRKRVRMIGTVLRSRPLEEKIALAREFESAVTPLFLAGALRPIIDRTFTFPDIAAAHAYLETNRSYGKIVLIW